MMCKCDKVMNMFEQVPKPQPSKPKPKSKAKNPLGSFAADLGRELTAKEREEIQKKSDLGFAKDLFGTTHILCVTSIQMILLRFYFIGFNSDHIRISY